MQFRILKGWSLIWLIITSITTTCICNMRSYKFTCQPTMICHGIKITCEDTTIFSILPKICYIFSKICQYTMFQILRSMPVALCAVYHVLFSERAVAKQQPATYCISPQAADGDITLLL